MSKRKRTTVPVKMSKTSRVSLGVGGAQSIFNGLNNGKRFRFAEEYIKDFNGAQAAIRAGFSNTGYTPHAKASELIRDPIVVGEIQRLMSEREKRLCIDRDKIVIELARIAFLDVTSLYDEETGDIKNFSELTTQQKSLITGYSCLYGKYHITKKAVFADKLKAMELLMRHLGMLNDKLKIDTTQNINLKIESSKLEGLTVDDLYTLKSLYQKAESRRSLPPISGSN